MLPHAQFYMAATGNPTIRQKSRRKPSRSKQKMPAGELHRYSGSGEDGKLAARSAMLVERSVA